MPDISLTPGVTTTPETPQGFAALAKPFSAPSTTEIVANSQPLQSTAQSQYLEGLIGANEPNKLMAANQGGWDELGNALIQSGGNLVLDIGEGLGYLNPYEIYKDVVNKDQEFGNSFSNWFAEKGKELGQEVPIYSDPENKRWHEWFFENVPSVVSGLSLLIPGYGIVKGVGALGKAAKGLKLAKAVGIGTASLEAAEVVGMSVLSRQMEGMMEGKELYDKMYQDGLARGMGEENAKKLAAEGAREVYTDNWALLASDIVQFSMGLKSFGKASRAYSDAQKAAKSLLNNKAYVFGTQMGLEGGEEVFQAVRQKENERQTLINAQATPEDYTTFKDRLYNYLGEADVQSAAFFGALGGGVFEAGANLLAKKEEKQRLERNNLINSSLEKQKAVFKNDPIKFNQENDVNMYSLMLDSIETGRADQVEELLNTALDGKFTELTQEEQTEVKANVAKYKTDLKDLEETFNSLKKDPTIQNDPQLSRYALANRAAYKIQEVTHKSLKTNQDKEILRLQQENNLDADTTKLIQAEVELSLLQNEFLKTEIKGLEKSTIEEKVGSLQKEVTRLQDQIKTNKQVVDLPDTSNINKSLLAAFSVPKLSTELDLDQLNKKFNQLGTLNGAAIIKKEINTAEQLKKEEGYKQTVVALQQVKSPEEVETLRKTAENLGKKDEFNNEYNKLVATKKEVAPKFDPANIKPSLTARYQNDPILFDAEITDIKKILLRNGGLPQEEELENEIETRYNSNPNFKKQLDEYFAQPTTLNTKDNTKPVGDEADNKQDGANNKQNVKEQNVSNLNTIWQLKGLQMEGPAYTNSKVQVIERKDSILKKSDWFALNTGKIKEGQKINFEYDTTREYNKQNDHANTVALEAVVYLDKNTNNKSDSNRIIVGVLPGYNVNNDKTFTLEANQQLKTLREKLFNEVKTSTQKTGIISLSPTTTVSRINPSRFWNIKDITKHNAPHEILRADEELLFGIAKYKKLGKENVTFLDTNGDGIINQMNPKDLTAGMTYLILQAPTGEYVATSTRVKNLGEVKEEFTKVKSLIEELKNNPQNADAIVTAINKITYIKDIRYVGNSLVVTTPDDKQETIEDVDAYLSPLLMKVDGDQINKGTYNIELSKKGWITTDINPFEHFHSTSVQVNPVTITQAKIDQPENIKVNVTVAPIQLEGAKLDTGVNVKLQAPNIDIVLGKGDIKYQISDGNEFTILNEQEVRGWFSKNLPQVNLLFVEQLIATSTDATAFGSYYRNLVTLYKGAPNTTAYHEAFHGVFDMLPKAQQEQLLNEQSAISGIARSNDITNQPKFDAVNYQLKAVEILQSGKGKLIFEKGEKAKWSLDKILTELQVPKQQKELIASLGITNREEIITSLMASYTYTVETNVAIETSRPGRVTYNPEDGFQPEEFDEDGNPVASVTFDTPQPTQHYARLSVPGGTNYTENEIKTPNIEPTIKGHAAFSTTNGIGWFRSDEKTKNVEEEKNDVNEYGNKIIELKKEPTKTRRILEVQSDLFQKGRDKEVLIGDKQYTAPSRAALPSWNQRRNDFLQLLNKDNTWVSFFIKSIVQDSANKGYNKVLFPTGDTASRVEGHDTLSDFKRYRENRIKQLEEAKERNKEPFQDTKGKWHAEAGGMAFATKEEALVVVEEVQAKAQEEIDQFKEEIKNVDEEGFAALKPIYSFYENTVGNILKKTYGNNITRVVDEHGNSWYELNITPEHQEQVKLSTPFKEYYEGLSNDVRLEEQLADAFASYIMEERVNEGTLPSNIRNFFKSLWQYIKSIFTSNISKDELFFRINQGFYKKAKPTNNSQLRYDTGKLHPAVAMERVKMINYYFFEQLKAVANAYDLQDLSDIEILKKINSDPYKALTTVYGQVYGALQKAHNAQPEGDVKVKLRQTLDNLLVVDEEGNISGTGDLYKLAVRELSHFGIKVKFSDKSNQDTTLEEEIPENPEEDTVQQDEEKTEAYEVKAIQKNQKDSIGFKVKKLLRTSPAFVKNANGEIELATNDIGFYKLIEFDDLYNTLQTNLADISSRDEALSVLENLKEQKYELHGLIKKLTEDDIMLTQFVSHFAQSQNEYIQIYESVTYANEGGEETENRKFIVSNANKRSTNKILADTWQNNLLNVSRNDITNADLSINKEKADRYAAAYIAIINDINKSKIVTEAQAEQLSKILESFGIEIPAIAISNQYVKALIPYKNNYVEIHPYQNFANFIKDVTAIVTSIKNGQNPYEGETTSVLDVTKKVAKSIPNLHQSVILSSSGKNTYVYSLQTYLSKLVKDLKNPAYREELLGNWWFKHNTFLQELNKPENDALREQFNYGIFSGITYNHEEVGNDYADLTPFDLSVADINLFDNNGSKSFAYYRLPILGDSSLSPLLRFKKFTEVEVIDGLHKIALAEQARTKMVTTLDTNIKFYNTNGTKYKFLEIFNDNEIQPDNETGAKQLIGEWLQSELLKEKARLTQLGVIDKQTGQFNKVVSSSRNTDKLLKEYFYNNVLSLSNIIQLTSVDLAFFDNYSLFTKRNGQAFKFTTFLDTQASYEKEFVGDFYNTIYLKDEKFASPIKPNIIALLKKTGHTQAYAEKIASYYDNINQTDAQAYITIDRYKKVMIGLGRWNQQYEASFQAVKANKANFDDVALFLQPIKPFFYGMEKLGDLIVPVQNKNSEVVLIPQFAKQSKQLKKLLKYMEDNQIDSAQFNSTVKVGEHGAVAFDSIGKEAPTVHTLQNRDYGIQTEVPEKHVDTEILFGSQLRKIAIADIKDATKFFDGKYSKEKIVEIYNNLIEANLKESYEETKEVFDNIEQLQEVLIQATRDRNLDYFNEQALELSKDDLGNKRFVLPLYAPINSKGSQAMVNSLIRSRITKQKINGASLVLMSNFGLSDKLNIKFDADGNIDYMEVMLPSWTKDKYFNGMDFDKIPQELLDLIGYRIPTEHKYSIKKLKVVGFTPNIMGGVAILPAEITKIAGEDFDIDKMYVLIPNFNVKEGKLSKVKYDLDNLNLLNKRQRDNAIIDIIGEVWKSQSEEVLTPGTFSTLVDFANYLRNVLKINDNLNPILPSSNIDYFKNITNGGGLIGLAANQSSNHSIIQYTETELTKSIDFDEQERSSLNQLNDIDGRLISRNLAEYISAFVDNVKDPVAGILNINADTFKVLAAINRVGYGLETGFAFINQPVIRRLTELTQSMSYERAVKTLEDILKVKVNLEEAKGKTNFTTDELLSSINTTPLEDLTGWDILKQAKVLSSYKVYKTLADSVSTLVNSTKSDSNGVDKNIAGIVTVLNRIKTLQEDKNIKTNVFETKNIASTFLKYGVKEPLNNFINKYFPYSNDAYTSLLSRMETIKGSTLTDKEIEYLYNHATAWYMSNFSAFNVNEKKVFIEKFADAFVAKRNLIKDYKFSKYIRYVGKTKDNLIPKLELYSNITITKEQVRDIKLSWETMIMSTNPEVSKLGKDLVKYAYFTTNFNFNFTGFSHLVPPSYLLNIKDHNDATYAENLHKLLPESKASNIFDDFVADFVQNNHNNKIIPTFRKSQLESKLINKQHKLLTSFALKGAGEYVKVKDGKFLRTYEKSGLTPDGKSDVYNLIASKGYNGIFEYNKTAQNNSVLTINELPALTDKDFLDSIEVYAQLEPQTVAVNDKLKETMFRFLSSLGIKVEYTNDIYERTGVDAVALADLTTNTILVSKGKKGINALPEEVGHFAEAYSRGTVFHNTLMNLVPKTKEYAEVVKKYGVISNDPEYLTRETIGQLIGKAIVKQDKAAQDSAGKGVMDYLRVVWKKFLDLFKSSDEMALVKEVEEITGIIARKVINNETDIFKTKVDINGTFYALGNTKILTEQKVLKDAADSLYKKIKIYEGKAISSFTESEQVILDKLVKDFNDKNYKEGIHNYVVKAVEELGKVAKRYTEVNTAPETLEEAQETLSMLKSINNYVHGFKKTIDEISKLREVDGYSQAIIETINNASRLGNRLANEYYTIGQPILKKVLKEFTTNDKLDLDAALNRLETDISWTQRWLDSLAETNSDVLSVLDKLVKDTKNTARRTTIAGTKSVVASQKEMEKGGYSATSIVAERNFNGEVTGRYVTEFNMGEYYKRKEDFFKGLGPKPDPKFTASLKQWKKAVAKWYKDNTQLRPDVEAYKQAKFLEFKERYKKEEVAIEKYNEWLEDNAIFADAFNPQTREYERVVLQHKAAFYIPAEKYRSSVYSMIQANPHIKQYHDTIVNTLKELDSKLPPAYKLNGFLPQVRKDFFERLMFTDKDGSKKLKSASALKASVGELFTRTENDTEFGLTDEKGVPINFIPVYFTRKVNPNDLSLDITSTTIAFMSSANDFAGMNKIIDTLEYAKDTVGVADLIKKGFDPITLWKDKTITNKEGKDINVKEITESGEKSLIYQRLTDYINMVGYGQLKDIETIKVGNKTIDAGKLADFVNTYTSMTSLALNIYSGISNITFGAIQTSMEGMAGEYYTNKDLLDAEILYTRELPNSLMNIGKVLDKETSLDEWDIYMNVMQNYNRDFRDLDAARNRAQRLLNTSSLFFINHAGEHWLQNITSLALANRIKLKNKAGKEYTLWQAFKEFGTKLHLQEFYKVKGEKGTDLFKENEDGKRFTEKDLNRVINRQNFVNKRLHGIYNDMDKAAFQKRAIGRIVMMFRKFIKPGWNRRYEKLRYNEEGEVWTEGYYTTFKNLFMNMFGEINEGKASLVKNWDKLTPLEKANLFRLGTEVAFLLMTIAMVAALTQIAEDDEDNYALNLAAYEAYRLYSELRFYTSITEVQRIIKSPAAGVYTLEKLNKFLSVWDWSDEVKRGKWKGFTKGEARTLDLIPLGGTYINFRSPDEQLKFFANSGLTIF